MLGLGLGVVGGARGWVVVGYAFEVLLANWVWSR